MFCHGLQELFDSIANYDIMGRFPAFNQNTELPFSVSCSISRKSNHQLAEMLNRLAMEPLERGFIKSNPHGMYFTKAFQLLNFSDHIEDRRRVFGETFLKLQSDLEDNLLCPDGILDVESETRSCEYCIKAIFESGWFKNLIRILQTNKHSSFHVRLLWLLISQNICSRSPTRPLLHNVQIIMKACEFHLNQAVSDLVKAAEKRYFFYEGAKEEWHHSIETNNKGELESFLRLLSKTFIDRSANPYRGNRLNGLSDSSSSDNGCSVIAPRPLDDKDQIHLKNNVIIEKLESILESNPRWIFWQNRWWFLEEEDPRSRADTTDVAAIEKIIMQKECCQRLQRSRQCPLGTVDFTHDRLLDFSDDYHYRANFFNGICGWLKILHFLIFSGDLSPASSSYDHQDNVQSFVSFVENWRLAIMQELLKTQNLSIIVISQSMISAGVEKFTRPLQNSEWFQLTKLFSHLSSKIKLSSLKSGSLDFDPSNTDDCSKFVKFVLEITSLCPKMTT